MRQDSAVESKNTVFKLVNQRNLMPECFNVLSCLMASY